MNALLLLIVAAALAAAGGAAARTTELTVQLTGGPEGTVTETTATFIFAATLRTAQFSCSLDGAAASTCASPVAYAGLAEGPHAFQVTASAGRETATASRRWRVAAQPPAVPPPPPPAPPPPPDPPPGPPDPPGPLPPGPRERIVFVSSDGDNDIWTMNGDGTGGQAKRTSNGTDDRDPDWSAVGDRLAYAAVTRGGDHEIATIASDGGDPVLLTASDAEDGQPVWLPDGSRIAFASDRDGDREIFAMDASGGDEQQLTGDPAVDDAPSWVAGQNRIGFHSTRDGGPVHLFTMGVDGADETLVADALSNYRLPDWHLAGGLKQPPAALKPPQAAENVTVEARALRDRRDRPALRKRQDTRRAVAERGSEGVRSRPRPSPEALAHPGRRSQAAQALRRLDCDEGPGAR